MNSSNEGKSIVLFDGECNFCNTSIQFIILNDKKKRFLFAPLQSVKAKELLASINLNNEILNTIVLIENNKVHLRSSAALNIVKQLNGLYPLLYCLVIVPTFIRDTVYNLIATNRYKWFGKREECMRPSQEDKERFIP